MTDAKNCENCPCTRKSCPRHGDCAACRAHHKTSKYPPQCEKRRGKKRENQKEEKQA